MHDKPQDKPQRQSHQLKHYNNAYNIKPGSFVHNRVNKARYLEKAEHTEISEQALITSLFSIWLPVFITVVELNTIKGSASVLNRTKIGQWIKKVNRIGLDSLSRERSQQKKPNFHRKPGRTEKKAMHISLTAVTN